ncbi:MAG: hypothetical protein N3A58_06605 [Spirochaetes bacterium]|nr:hypothetical protein [Spirochaetota bacterium]
MDNKIISYLKNIINNFFKYLNKTLSDLSKYFKNNYKSLIRLIPIIIALIIFILAVLTIYNLKYKKLDKYKFYFVDYYGKIKYEKFNLPLNYNVEDICSVYFSGPFNKKKFPDYIFNLKYYEKIDVRDKKLYLVLNNEGLKKINEINDNILKLIGVSIKRTFMIHKIKIEKIIFISSFTGVAVKEINVIKK